MSYRLSEQTDESNGINLVVNLIAYRRQFTRDYS